MSNPTLAVADIPKLADLAHAKGATLDRRQHLHADDRERPPSSGPTWSCTRMTKFVSRAHPTSSRARSAPPPSSSQSLMDPHTGALMLLGPDDAPAHRVRYLAAAARTSGCAMQRAQRAGPMLFAERLRDRWASTSGTPGCPTTGATRLLATPHESRVTASAGSSAIDLGTTRPRRSSSCATLQNTERFGYDAVSPRLLRHTHELLGRLDLERVERGGAAGRRHRSRGFVRVCRSGSPARSRTAGPSSRTGSSMSARSPAPRPGERGAVRSGADVDPGAARPAARIVGPPPLPVGQQARVGIGPTPRRSSARNSEARRSALRAIRSASARSRRSAARRRSVSRASSSRSASRRSRFSAIRSIESSTTSPTIRACSASAWAISRRASPAPAGGFENPGPGRGPGRGVAGDDGREMGEPASIARRRRRERGGDEGEGFRSSPMVPGTGGLAGVPTGSGRRPSGWTRTTDPLEWASPAAEEAPGSALWACARAIEAAAAAGPGSRAS
jgi:hypothetical protein